MKQFFVVAICLSLVLCGCASSMVKTSTPNEILSGLKLSLQRNMTPEQVVNLMGDPSRPILIYFYLTENEDSFLSRLSKDNYTPIVFVDNKLEGWGWDFLNGAAKDIMND